MTIERNRIELDCGTVSWLEWRPTKELQSTIMLLHGGGFDSASLSWGAVGPALAAAGHRVIAPDHPGYGESPLPSWPSSQQNLLSYLDQFLDHLELDGYVLGGLSLGGSLTLGRVVTDPAGIDGIVLLGSYGFMQRQRTGPTARPLHLLTWLSVRIGLMRKVFQWSGRSRRLVASSVGNIVRDPAQRTAALLDEVLATGRGSSATAFAQWQRDQCLPTRFRDDYTDRLAELDLPALIIHGDKDVGVPVALAQAAADRMADAELVLINNAGHWVQRDRPDVAIPAMINFLDRIGSTADASPTHS